MDTHTTLKKPERRSFLRMLAIGGGLLAMGGIVSRINNFKNGTFLSEGGDIGNLHKLDKGNEVVFYDQGGAEILIIEKDA